MEEVETFVYDALAPIEKVLIHLDTTKEGLTLVSLIANVIYLACYAAGQIPKIGAPFLGVSNIMKPVKQGVDKVLQALKTFDNIIGNFLQKSIRIVLDLIETFGSNLMYGISDAALFVGDVIESGFVRDVLKSIVKVDMITPIETMVEFVKDHALKLVEAMNVMYDVIKTTVFQTISSAMTTLEAMFDKVEKFFEPFNPLDILLNTKVKLPWFKPPYVEKKLG